MPVNARSEDRRILVAALGSPLRGDDGFGPALLERLRPHLSPRVRAEDFGTHGLSLVQRLHDRFGALVLLDACARGGAAGTVYVLEPKVAQVAEAWTVGALDAFADMHLSTPDRALRLAFELGVLPESCWLVGCEVETVEGHRTSLSGPVTAALDAACAEALRLVEILDGGHGRRTAMGGR